MKWFSIPELAERYSVASATVTGWIDDGQMEAVNIARKGSVRKRYRVSEKALAEFERRRGSDTSPASPVESRKAVPRPTKDYFAGVAQ